MKEKENENQISDIKLKVDDNKQYNEIISLRGHPIKEEDNLSQQDEMIKKQRQITDLSSDDGERQKTNNNITEVSYFYHKLGRCYAFFGDTSGNPLIIIGPQWPMFLSLSLLINGIIWFFLIKYWDDYSNIFKTFGIFFVLFFQFTFTHCFLANPGFPKNDIGKVSGIPKERYKFCPECKFYYDLTKNVNHCFDCGICIEGYDHHCPWVSKCIGKNNLYSFYGFMAGILFNFGFGITCLINLGR